MNASRLYRSDYVEGDAWVYRAEQSIRYTDDEGTQHSSRFFVATVVRLKVLTVGCFIYLSDMEGYPICWEKVFEFDEALDIDRFVDLFLEEISTKPFHS